MQVTSLFKKNKFRMNRRGFSSIVGAIFMVLIVWSLASAYFFFTLSQNTTYNEAVRETNEHSIARMSESVQAINTVYKVQSNGIVTVTVNVQNIGSSTVQFTTLWVYVSENNWNNYGFIKEMAVTLQAGKTLKQDFNVPVTGVTITGTYNFAAWLVSIRGNTFALEALRTNNIVVAQVAQGIGSMALDFSAFRFFEYATSTRLASYSDGIKSFNVPSGTNIAFGALLTNLDPSEQTIILDKYSQLWLYFPQSPGQTRLWYVVNVDSIGNIASSYSPISIAYMETKLIVFASSAAGSFSSGSGVSILHSDDTGALNLLLLGTIGPRDYGQNIPFVALYVRP